MPAKKIFLVDDSQVILAIAGAALHSDDCEVQTGMSWEELDQMLKAGKPDLILMDVNMPGVTGDFAVSFFKEQRGLAGTPILLFSDIDVRELEQRAKDCGADGFVSKSWGTDRLRAEVRKYLPR